MKSSSAIAFERRFDILIYAVRATEAFTIKDVYECVLGSHREMILKCLDDLVSLELLDQLSATKYQASVRAKHLLGVMPCH